MRPPPSPPTVIGWREWIALPALGIARLEAKVDTGARTSALHATQVAARQLDGETLVDFHIPSDGPGQWHTATAVDRRMFKNTSGKPEQRWVIRTAFAIAGRRWAIELSLTDRAEMIYDLILGRTAIRRHGLLIDPGRSFLAGEPLGSRIKAGG